MASVSDLQRFEKFYLNAELTLENYTISDALMEFVNSYPEIEGMTLQQTEQYAEKHNLVFRRKMVVDKVSHAIHDQVRHSANVIGANIAKAIEQTLALELTVINNMIVELSASLDIQKLSGEEKVKLMKVLLDRSGKMQETSFKMQKEGLAYSNYSSKSYQPTTQEEAEDRETEEPKEPKASTTKSLEAGEKVDTLRLQAAQIAIEHSPIPKTPPPSQEQFKHLQKMGDSLKASRRTANQDVDDDE